MASPEEAVVAGTSNMQLDDESDDSEDFSDMDEEEEAVVKDKEEDVREEDEIFVVNKDNPDYFEIPLRKRAKGPPTKDLVHIPKERLLQFQELYEKQPQKVKEMMRIPFCDGKPVTKPPPLGLFVKRITSLEDKRKAKKKFKNKQLQKRMQAQSGHRHHREEGPSTHDSSEPKVNDVEVFESDTTLVHVDYPGRVENVDKAIETMGGIRQITKSMISNKKLSVKFRPHDLHCNAVRGDPIPSIGLLLRVRYKKPPPATTVNPLPPDINIGMRTRRGGQQQRASSTKQKQTEETEGSGPGAMVFGGIHLTKEQILYEDSQLMKQRALDTEVTMQEYYGSEDPGRCYLRLPKNYNPTDEDRIQIETLGIVNKSYKFDGLCDFQYLPMKSSKGGMVSTRDQLYPVVADPTGNPECLFASHKLFGENEEIDEDIVPPIMSHIDKPLDAVAESIMDADNVKLSAELREKTGVLSTVRARRNVYTIVYSFQTEKSKSSAPIPNAPLAEALEDIKKRKVYTDILPKIRKMFEDKPIWSRTAMEVESGEIPNVLKFVTPCVAYFATNGPWRSLWIRFGYDPRDIQESFIYQIVDFRVPVMYKGFMIEPEKMDDTFYKFRPNSIPPRVQMFYQLFNIECEEIDRLRAIALAKIKKGGLPYDCRYGWLKEGTFEYIRHVLTQYVEARLEEIGKIAEYPTQRLFLADGQLVYHEKLIPRPRSKRLRKSRNVGGYKAVPQGRDKNMTKSTTISKGKRKGKAKGSIQWAYQGILEDLSIKDIGKYGARKSTGDGEAVEDILLSTDEEFDDDNESGSDNLTEDD